MLNQTLRTAIQTVVQTVTYTQFNAVIQFISSTNSSYSYSPLQIEEIMIEQDAVTQYADRISVRFMVALADYANMYDNMQDLHAVLTLYYCDNTGARITTMTPIQQTYRAMIVDPKDVRKQVVDTQHRTEFDRQITVRLMEDTIYNLRNTEFHTIYQACTVENAMRHASSVFGITALTMDPPNNIHQYDHILIPPNKSFGTFYEWMQAKYGVYMCGLTHYYTGGHLYIYAPFNIQPTTEKTLVVYQAEQGLLSGITNFSRVNGTNLEVVTNSIHDVTDHSTMGSENRGTSAMFLRSSEIMDGVVQHDPVNGVKFNQDAVLNISLANPKTLTAGNNKTVYLNATDNAWAVASHLQEAQATMITFEWLMAIPLQIRPGMAVTFNSDSSGQVLVRTGIVEKLSTLIKAMQRGPEGIPLFRASVMVTVRLQPEGVLTSTVSA